MWLTPSTIASQTSRPESGQCCRAAKDLRMAKLTHRDTNWRIHPSGISGALAIRVTNGDHRHGCTRVTDAVDARYQLGERVAILNVIPVGRRPPFGVESASRRRRLASSREREAAPDEASARSTAGAKRRFRIDSVDHVVIVELFLGESFPTLCSRLNEATTRRLWCIDRGGAHSRQFRPGRR